MSFEEVIGTVMGWTTAVEALSAVGADIALRQSGTEAPPEVASALRAVCEAAGLGDLAELPPPQQAMVLMQVKVYLHHADELLANPAREPGWNYTDPVILEGWGRGSAIVPTKIAEAPELNDVRRFLDTGSGVGHLAVAAAGLWPNATVVGIDIWEPSIERARANVEAAGLSDRIELRTQNIVELDDTDEYDCIWVPTFFFTEPALDTAIPRFFRATQPGGWIVLGRFAPPPDPLAEAVRRLQVVRSGGSMLDSKRCVEILEQAGCESVRALPRGPGVPLEFVIGRKN